MSKKILFAIAALSLSVAYANILPIDTNIKSYKFGSTTEWQIIKPDETTKKLVSSYLADPTEANLEALKEQIESDCDKIIAEKKAKLAKLKEKSTNQTKIFEMQEVVERMILDKQNRVNEIINKLTKNCIKIDTITQEDKYLPILKAGYDVSVLSEPVTNIQYAQFIKDTGYNPPVDFAIENPDNPVINVSYYDALAYCNWISKNDSKANYRLPTAKEWDFAEDIIQKSNILEWTTTSKDSASKIVKGNIKTKKKIFDKVINRDEFRVSNEKYNNVGFRIIRVK